MTRTWSENKTREGARAPNTREMEVDGSMKTRGERNDAWYLCVQSQHARDHNLIGSSCPQLRLSVTGLWSYCNEVKRPLIPSLLSSQHEYDHHSALVKHPHQNQHLLLRQYPPKPAKAYLTPPTPDTPKPSYSESTSPASSVSPQTPVGVIDDTVKIVSHDTYPGLSIVEWADYSWPY